MSSLDLDTQLVQQMMRGDASALNVLYDKYTPVLYSVALRIVRDPAEAEEAIQDAWVYAWKKVHSFDASRGSLAGWLVMIARSRALDRYRSRLARRAAEETIEVEAAHADDPASLAEHRDLSERMRVALAELKPEQRRAIEVAFFEGLSHSQVARRLDKPLGTVKYWIREGLVQLSERLPKEGVS